MQKRQDIVLRHDGRGAAGATITVTTSAGAAATLYSADGSGAYSTNTVTADDTGEYSYYAANGRYNEAISYGSVSETKSDVLLFDPDDAGATAIEITDSGSYFTSTTVEGALQEVGAKLPETIMVACSDETTALTAGTGKVKFPMPFAMNPVQEVGAGLSTVQTGGSTFTVDINEGGSTILSTKITVDNGESTSVTAATAPVLSDTALAKGAMVSVDIDQIGDGTAKGLKVWITGQRA